jgi:hypothetical protein
MSATQTTKRVVTRVFALVIVLAIAACGGSSGGGSSNSGSELDDRDPSVARLWNEVLLNGIRGDFARPTVHARNLFHISSAMYDAWAVYSGPASPYLLGNTLADYQCDLDRFDLPDEDEVNAAREEAISYAAYQLIRYRFRLSPSVLDTEDATDELLESLGYDKAFRSTDYSDGSAAALGNHIAECYIAYGLQDGSNEAGFFANQSYLPVNPEIKPLRPGNPTIEDLDRWQPISLPTFIDQSGNEIDTDIEFLSPEWGQVESFALTDEVKETYTRDGSETKDGSDFDYPVYYDPGAPPTAAGSSADDYNPYKWGFSLVSIWSSHLDQSDGVMIDISPASLGSPNNAVADRNNPYYPLPEEFDTYDTFYNTLEGGDASTGYRENPVTGEPYEPQLVLRGDYARVLAEFWADGPESETPPGHWFVIFNEVTDHPLLERRIGGLGQEVGPLEWDIKGYFIMGGAMHDAAIASWGIKGWYDYVRPLSAIRAMADLGQSSDSDADSYDPEGIPLQPGYIETVIVGDPLAGEANEHVGKIKLYAWRGPDYIDDPDNDQAGVDWILAENWWPYQRPTFVTPPFAGYVSGHSTYSRAAAEVMTDFTGDEYFPGGMSGFEVKANEFLVFEEGPSEDMTLEWATYRDASDQCSLSRIWGGIHPPADDIPGRFIGYKIGPAAVAKASEYFGN